MRSKVYPIESQISLNVSETDTFESFQKKGQYKIKHHLDCLMYLLSCQTCGLRYVGSTTDRSDQR